MASFCNDTTSFCNCYSVFKRAVSKSFINKNVYFRFRFSRSAIFKNKATTFLEDGLYRKISPPNENTALAVRTFS